MATFICLFSAGVYRGLWKFTGAAEIGRFFVGSLLSSMLSVFLVVLIYRFESFSRSVFLLYGMLLFISISLTRLSFKLISHLLVSIRQPANDAIPVLIYGAGDEGENTLKWLNGLNGSNLLTPIRFLDDDKKKHKQKIHGVPVLGSSGQIHDIHQKTRFQQIILASEKIPVSHLEEIRQFCRENEVSLKRFRWVSEDVL